MFTSIKTIKRKRCYMKFILRFIQAKKKTHKNQQQKYGGRPYMEWCYKNGLLPLAQTSRRVNLIMIHVHFCRNGDIRGQSLGS
jgi:aldehyde:ferredoxin oxidoreductase